MANPNIVNVSDIKGKTVVSSVTTVSSNIVVNASASNKIVKLNTLYVSNTDVSNLANVSVSVLRSGTETKLANQITVPVSASIIIISKDSSIYLEEGDALRVQASANSTLQSVCSYEEIS